MHGAYGQKDLLRVIKSPIQSSPFQSMSLPIHKIDLDLSSQSELLVVAAQGLSSIAHGGNHTLRRHCLISYHIYTP